jgi:hypothetical protein
LLLVRRRIGGLEGIDQVLHRDSLIHEELAAVAANSCGKRRCPAVLVDNHHGSGTGLDLRRGQRGVVIVEQPGAGAGKECEVAGAILIEVGEVEAEKAPSASSSRTSHRVRG